ncbi:unnamed protein product [Absidia cylindrospora]
MSRIPSLKTLTCRSMFGRRQLATATQLLPTLRKTILPNGFTVATEENSASQTATVGVWIDAGSRAENTKNNGSANFWNIWPSRAPKLALNVI